MVDAVAERILGIMMASSARGGKGRSLTLWLCSFLGVGTLLVYAGVPLGPVLIAGALTLGITVVRNWR